MNKKRIITILMAVLLVLSFVITPLRSPVEVRAMMPVVLSDPYEDLKISEGFDESKYADATDITVVDLFEYWENGADIPEYLLYVYNPTERTLKDSTDNSIHIRLGGLDKETEELRWVNHWNTYKLKYLATSENGKYVKYKISNADELYSVFSDFIDGSRYYDVSEVKLTRDSENLPYTVRAGLKYKYSLDENGELTVNKESYDVIRVDELVPMVYRKIVEDVYDYPNGQINSVAFSISNEILEEYGAISDIHFEYFKYRTSPIVVSDTRNGLKIHERRDEWVGRYREGGQDDQSNPLGLMWGAYINDADVGRTAHYGYNGYSIDLWGNKAFWGFDITKKEYRKLCYSFCSGDVKATDYDVSSEELKNWIYSYADTYLSGQEYESVPIKDGKLPAELFENYNDEEYGYKNVIVSADTLKSKDNYAPNWWEQFWMIDTSYNVEYETIQSVIASDMDMGDSAIAYEYKVNSGYVEDLKELSTNAQKEDKTAIVFHFDVSDYYCSPALVLGEFGGKGGTKNHAYVAQEDVYLNFNFIDFTFTKNEVSTVLAVSSPVIDITPEIQHPEVPKPFDFWYWIKLILGIALVVLLVLIFWNPLIALLEIVVKIVIFPFKAIFTLLEDKIKNRRKK